MSIDEGGVMDKMSETWSWREYPVLLAIARRFEASGGELVTLPEVVEATGLSQQEVTLAAKALHEDGLIEATGVAAEYPVWWFGRLSSEARRKTGLWPTPDSERERFLATLDEAIDQADGEDRTWLEKLRDSAGRVTEGALTTVIGAYMARYLP